jgi:hypothetical protein
MWHVCKRGEYSLFFFFGEKSQRDHTQATGTDGKITLRQSSRKRMYGLDWTELAQDGVKWQALVNAVMNTEFPQNAGD